MHVKVQMPYNIGKSNQPYSRLHPPDRVNLIDVSLLGSISGHAVSNWRNHIFTLLTTQTSHFPSKPRHQHHIQLRCHYLFGKLISKLEDRSIFNKAFRAGQWGMVLDETFLMPYEIAETPLTAGLKERGWWVNLSFFSLKDGFLGA